ncbi:DUF3784 domain-containing protein [uncultured Clostridium sp.]|uniref:DUF3784 domain-containing protein n=1 Tax=uncultured Clostridium sp. TaxID=59620 RepID=UPI002613475F|nr:DUF3784 domain-containing protein [uncultured Clostridium sp.]
MILISIIFLVIGLMIHVFKMYFLISGYSMMTDSQRDNENVKRLGKHMGICCYAISGIFAITLILREIHPNIEIIAFALMFIIIAYMLMVGHRFDISGDSYQSESKAAILTMLLPISLIMFVCFYSFGSVEIEVDSDGIEVENIKIAFDEIEEYKMLYELPDNKKIFGARIGYFNRGDFEVEGYGECKLYTSDSDHSIVIKTDEETYIVNDSGNTKVIYQQIVYEMNKLE